MAVGTGEVVEARSNARILGAISVGVAGVTLSLANGAMGAAAAAVLIVAWFLVPTVHAYALGQLLVVAVPELPTPVLVVIEAALLGVLFASLPRITARAGSVFVVAFLGQLAVLRGSYRMVGDLWVVAVALVGSVALVSYGLHRYESVRFGLIEEVSS